MKASILITLALALLFIAFTGCEKKSYEEKVKENLLGEWRLEEGNYTSIWFFFENNSVKTELNGKNVTWWKYQIKGEQLCFTNEASSKPICYKYEFLENYTILKVTYRNLTMYWHKVEAREYLIGEWRWEGNNQTGRWVFYENGSMLAEFTGKFAGAKSITWWKYEVKGDQICFTEPSNPLLTPGCYVYEFLENYTVLKVTYKNHVAYWYKVS